MKQRRYLILALSAVLILTVGCGKPADKPVAPQPVQQTDAGGNPVPTEVTIKTSNELIQLLATSEKYKAGGMSFEQDIKTGGQPMKSKVQMYGKSIRLDTETEGVKSVAIYREGVLYTYDPDQKNGTQFKTSDGTPEEAIGVTDPTSTMDPKTIEIQGSAKIDESPCVIFKVQNQQTGDEMKCWVDTRYGVVVRMETKADNQPYLLEVKKLTVGDVNPAVFEVPKDIKLTQM